MFIKQRELKTVIGVKRCTLGAEGEEVVLKINNKRCYRLDYLKNNNKEKHKCS